MIRRSLNEVVVMPHWSASRWEVIAVVEDDGRVVYADLSKSSLVGLGDFLGMEPREVSRWLLLAGLPLYYFPSDVG
tara:strand:+ start:1586 stop:1813 length:228 start_codon:yes stop_codon:yes gene_type:complete